MQGSSGTVLGICSGFQMLAVPAGKSLEAHQAAAAIFSLLFSASTEERHLNETGCSALSETAFGLKGLRSRHQRRLWDLRRNFFFKGSGAY